MNHCWTAVLKRQRRSKSQMNKQTGGCLSLIINWVFSVSFFVPCVKMRVLHCRIFLVERSGYLSWLYPNHDLDTLYDFRSPLRPVQNCNFRHLCKNWPSYKEQNIYNTKNRSGPANKSRLHSCISEVLSTHLLASFVIGHHLSLINPMQLHDRNSNI